MVSNGEPPGEGDFSRIAAPKKNIMIPRMFEQAQEFITAANTREIIGKPYVGEEWILKKEDAFIGQLSHLKEALDDPENHIKALHSISGLLSDNMLRLLPKTHSAVSKIALEEITELLENHRTDSSSHYFNCLLIAHSLSQQEEGKVKLMPILQRELSLFEQRLDTTDQNIEQEELSFILEYGSESQKEKVESRALNIFKNAGTTVDNIRIIDDRYFKNGAGLAKTYLAKYLSSLGLPAEGFLNQWSINRHQLDAKESTRNYQAYNEGYFQNISVINELQRRGVDIQKLHNEFGLTNFGRFPPDALELQSKEIQKPCIFAFYPSIDHNGGLMDTRKQLETFHSGTNKYANIIFTEVNDVASLKQKMKYLKNKYGNGIHGIFAGHGNFDGIQLGSGRKYYESHLTRQEFTPNSEMIQVIRDSFEPAASFVLISCSTGAEMQGQPGGFARFATRNSDFTFTGPEFEDGLDNIESIIDEDKVKDIQIKYSTVRAMKYKHGELIQ